MELILWFSYGVLFLCVFRVGVTFYMFTKLSFLEQGRVTINLNTEFIGIIFSLIYIVYYYIKVV